MSPQLTLRCTAQGEYLQDNYEVGILMDASIEWENHAPQCTFSFTEDDPCFVEWLNNGTGPYGEAAAPASAIWRSGLAEISNPDIFFYGGPRFAFPGIFPGLGDIVNSPTTWTWDITQMPGPGSDARGTVLLRSTNPREAPLIQFNYFEGEAGEKDLDALLAGAELVLDMWDETDGPGAPYTRTHPDPSIDLRQALKDEMFGHHASSSCRMGSNTDEMRCVDSEFRVKGTRKLRVVDASVFPRTPGAWPTVPTYMLGKKAADMLAKEYAQCEKRRR